MGPVRGLGAVVAGTLGRVRGAHVLVVVAGLLGGLLTLAALHRAESTTGVLVLTRDVAAGTRVGARDIATAQVHADDATLARLVRSEHDAQVIGRIATAPLHRGDLVRSSDLRNEAARGRRRSMSFAVDAADAVGGSIAVGDHVDVVGVSRDGARSGYVLTDTEIIAVTTPQSTGPLRSTDRRVTLTVGVDGAAALRLVAAQASGKVVVVNATGADPITAAANTFDNGSAPEDQPHG